MMRISTWPSPRSGLLTAGRPSAFDIQDEAERGRYIRRADIVISLLPPSLHIAIARDCVRFQKNLLTASYLDDATRELEPAISKNKLLFLYEMGLDPGIDHMSAMQLIDGIRKKAVIYFPLYHIAAGW